MVVLAASIVTRSGKLILSRQFQPLTQSRVMELITNFTTLLGESTSQHTTIEDENVRFVYQPLEELYLVLITNKGSNILQDIETLSSFVEVVSSIIRNFTTSEILDKSFEILSAFDEIIVLGLKENVSMLQIKTFLEMDSHEEKIAEIIEKNKEFEANEERKRRAKEIQRKELARRNMEFGANPNSVPSFGGNGYQPIQQQQQLYADSVPSPAVPAPQSKPKLAPKGRGLQLGKKKVRESEPLLDSSAASSPAPALATTHQPHTHQPQTHQPQLIEEEQAVKNNGILISIEEKISAEISREGNVISSELKGVLQLRICDESLSQCQIELSPNSNSNIQFKTHPNIDKNAFKNDNLIKLKNNNGFPFNDKNLGVLRWRSVSNDDSLPLTMSSWINSDATGINVTLEIETELDEFKILVPVSNPIEILNEECKVVDIGDDGVLISCFGSVAEFHINDYSEDEIFPIEVIFNKEGNLNDLKVVKIVNNEGDELDFDLVEELTTDGYYIV